MHGSVADLIGSIVYLDARIDFIPDSIERRNRMRRRATVDRSEFTLDEDMATTILTEERFSRRPEIS
jgi:hypothetical protein